MSFITDLEPLISSFVPKNCTFVDAQLRKLTSSGDNYGSVLLAVDIVVKNEETKEHIYAVAKKLPCNELVREMFNSRCTFPNEVGFYRSIAPCLRNFQKEQKMDKLVSSFPEFYAARVSEGDEKIESSVLLIKNIKMEGFETLDRTVGFDLVQAELILHKMAELHATTIALKVNEPALFQEKIAPFFDEYQIFVMDEDNNNKMIKGALDVIKNDEFCRRFLPKLEEVMKKSSVIIPTKNEKVPENPFFTLVHSDMWTNNIMVKIVDKHIKDVKFVDFQLYEYTSLTRDVVFFLYSSVQTDALKEKCDELLLHYYNSFIKWLKKLNCDVKNFSFDDFLEDMKLMVQKYEFFHIMTMLPPIYATSKDTKEVEQLEMDSFIFYGSEVTEVYREKACFIVKDLIRRKWLP